MPSNAPIIHTWGQLPPDYAPADWNDLVQQIAKLLSSTLSGSYNTFNWGSSTPAPEDQNKPWVRQNVDGSPDGVYMYFNGVWCRPHEIPASSASKMLWEGSTVDILSYDGGDGTADAPTAFTGAMWEIDTTFEDRIPIGVKNPGGLVTAVAGVAGTTTPTISIGTNNVPRHRHELTVEDDGQAESTGDLYDADSTGSLDVDAGQGAATSFWNDGSNRANVGYTRYYGKTTPDAITIPLPPIIGTYFIKRTARVYRTL
jgi:hypothetical protein